jgi:hypothetical protein
MSTWGLKYVTEHHIKINEHFVNNQTMSPMELNRFC